MDSRTRNGFQKTTQLAQEVPNPLLVKGRIISTDTMHTQKEWCAGVHSYGGYYLTIVKNRLHYRRDVTLGEDASQVRIQGVPQALAAINRGVLALMDWLGVNNVAQQ